jgi:hypothetical protein
MVSAIRSGGNGMCARKLDATDTCRSHFREKIKMPLNENVKRSGSEGALVLT